MSIILADAWLITMDESLGTLEKSSLLVEQGRISAIGSRISLSAGNPAAEVLDCTGRIVMPGMVNTHTHLFQTLLKGPGDDMVLNRWFTRMTLRAADDLSAEDAHIAALHGCVESLRSGVTTLVDFQYINLRPGLTEGVIRAFDESGIRGFVCRGFLSAGQDYGVPERFIETPEAALGHARELIRRHNRPGARVQVGLAPCMIWTNDADSLRKVRQLADEEKALITTHLAETDFEVARAFETYGKSETEVLAELGLLGSDLLAVHCVQCNTQDITLLAQSRTGVAHCPCSNLYLASGVAPIPEMLRQNVTVGLASDGPASSNNHNMFQAMKFAALSQKGLHRNAGIITAAEVLEMATIGGARAIGLDHEIGSLTPGKRADLIVIDTANAAMTPLHNPVSALVYSALGNEVTDVMVDGAFLMREGRFTTLPEAAIRARAQAAADALVTRAGIAPLARRGIGTPAAGA